MGNKQTVLSDEVLEHYVDCTFLTKQEVLRVFSRFCEIQSIPIGKGTDLTYEDLLSINAKYSDLSKCPELKENPFRKRICKAFSSNAGFGGPIVGNDGGEIQMTFDQFVLMYSVFSDRAPREMKIHYAFLIYDMDGDGFIGTTDIEHALKLLTQNELNMDEIQSVWEKVLVEGDIDDDHRLSKNEFQNVITKSPEFMTTFHFSI